MSDATIINDPAALAVIARLMKERNEARAALAAAEDTCHYTDERDALRVEVATCGNVLAACMMAIRPVLDWYQPDDQPVRRLNELLTDIVADLQHDRAVSDAAKAEIASLRITNQQLDTQLDAQLEAHDRTIQEAAAAPGSDRGAPAAPGRGDAMKRDTPRSEVEKLREVRRIAQKYRGLRCSYCGYVTPAYHVRSTVLFATHLRTCEGTREAERLRAFEAAAKAWQAHFLAWPVPRDYEAAWSLTLLESILAGTKPEEVTR